MVSFVSTTKISTTGLTALEKKPLCSSIGSTIAKDNNIIKNKDLVNIAADQVFKENLQLVLSPNLTISVSTSKHVVISNHLNNCSIDFVQKEYTKDGDHNNLWKLVFNVSPAEFFQLKSSANSIDFFLQFIDNKNVKTSVCKTRKKSWKSNHWSYHHHLIPSYCPASMIISYRNRLRKKLTSEKIIWKLAIDLLRTLVDWLRSKN